jgi:hypothetical protein
MVQGMDDAENSGWKAFAFKEAKYHDKQQYIATFYIDCVFQSVKGSFHPFNTAQLLRYKLQIQIGFKRVTYCLEGSCSISLEL